MKRIAVIGSGIAGLTAAYYLSRKHEVFLFEKEPRLGGHTQTVTGGGINHRAGSRGYRLHRSQRFNLPQSGAVANGVERSASQFRHVVAVSCRKTGYEYSSRGVRGFFAQKRNVLSSRPWKLFGEIRLLVRDGSMLMQTITIPDRELAEYRRRVDWIQTYVFPGSELASLGEIQRSLAKVTQMSLANLESFGMHYERTLSLWRERFFQQLGEVQRLGFDERFQRMWDFYLAWCEGAFRERYINVAHLLLAKNGTSKALLGDPMYGQQVGE